MMTYYKPKENNNLESISKSFKALNTQSGNFFNRSQKLKPDKKFRSDLFDNFDRIINNNIQDEYVKPFNVNTIKTKIDADKRKRLRPLNINIIFGLSEESEDEVPEFRETFVTLKNNDIERKRKLFSREVRYHSINHDSSNFGLNNIRNDISNFRKKISSESEDIKLLLKQTKETRENLKKNINFKQASEIKENFKTKTKTNFKLNFKNIYPSQVEEDSKNKSKSSRLFNMGSFRVTKSSVNIKANNSRNLTNTSSNFFNNTNNKFMPFKFTRVLKSSMNFPSIDGAINNNNKFKIPIVK